MERLAKSMASQTRLYVTLTAYDEDGLPMLTETRTSDTKK
jgi:hypothetical protein